MQVRGVRNIDLIESGDRLFIPRVPRVSVDRAVYNQKTFLYGLRRARGGN